jgi:hypothetical protein
MCGMQQARRDIGRNLRPPPSRSADIATGEGSNDPTRLELSARQVRRHPTCVRACRNQLAVDQSPIPMSKLRPLPTSFPDLPSSCQVDVARPARTRRERIADRVGQLRTEAV